MSAVRGWLLFAAAMSLVYAILGLFWLERIDFIAGSVLAALLVCSWGFRGLVEEHREEMRQGRDECWQRRIREGQR